jgi:hypothetical protein
MRWFRILLISVFEEWKENFHILLIDVFLLVLIEEGGIVNQFGQFFSDESG